MVVNLHDHFNCPKKIMTNEELIEELKALASQLTIPVRFETGDFEGGLCLINDSRVLIVNRKATVPKKISTIAAALAECGLDSVYVKPAVREAIEDELAKLRAEQPRAEGQAAPAEK